MKKYLIILLIAAITISGFLYLDFRFDKIESEIERSTLFISDTLDIMESD